MSDSSTKPLPRSTPEAQGIASSTLRDYIEALDREVHDIHSIMIVRHGHVVAEGWWTPFQPQELHMLFSLSKSFTSTAIGMLVAEGKLSVDDKVTSFFPDDLPAEVSNNLAAMQVKHLLAMNTGHDVDTTESLWRSSNGNWAKAFLAQPVVYTPGTHFLYNTGATYMLSAIVQRLSGQRLLHYLTPRLFEPLGIEGAWWQQDPRGIDTGGFGLNIRTEDIAKFGLLYAQKGMWQGKRLIEESWIDAASSTQSDNASKTEPNPESDWQQGYGYQFWRCRNNAYRGDGAFGQYCVVMPDQDTVLAITGGMPDMQLPLTLTWQHLLPALQAAPLPENPSANAQLNDALSTLQVPVVAGQSTSPVGAQVTGRSYAINANEANVKMLAYDFSKPAPVITMTDDKGTHSVTCGDGTWNKSVTTFGGDRPGDPQEHVAVCGAWTSDDTYVAKVYFYRTPFCITLTAQFDGTTLNASQQVNVSFGPTEPVTLTGKQQ